MMPCSHAVRVEDGNERRSWYWKYPSDHKYNCTYIAWNGAECDLCTYHCPQLGKAVKPRCMLHWNDKSKEEYSPEDLEKKIKENIVEIEKIKERKRATDELQKLCEHTFTAISHYFECTKCKFIKYNFQMRSKFT
jgi:hypothetical protein